MLRGYRGVNSGESVIAPCVWMQSGLVSIAVNEVLGGISLSYHVYKRSGWCMEQKHGLVSYTSKFPKKKKIVLCKYIHASPTLFFSSQHTEIYRLYITLVWSALNLVKMTTGFFILVWFSQPTMTTVVFTFLLVLYIFVDKFGF